jgi:peptide/nickel transport system permease protein
VIVYVVRRILFAMSLLLGISFGAFAAFGLSLDPTYPLLLGGEEGLHQRHLLQVHYHLTDPIVVRYLHWLHGLVTHGFGTTVLPTYGRVSTGGLAGSDIDPLVWHAAAVTAQLVAVSLLVVVAGSAVVGAVAARRPSGVVDLTLRTFAYVTWSVPTFVIGIELLQWFGGPSSFGPPGGGLGSWLGHMVLPVATLSLGLVGLYSRYVRSAMLVSLAEPYTVVARAKGLPERRVVFQHALRNSLAPFVSVVSLELGAVVGASLATDYVFRMNGLAVLFLQALGAADPFELTAIVVVLAVVVIVFMLVADVVVGRLDPRIRLGGAAQSSL